VPILHFNGYEIANTALRAHIGRKELEQLLRGHRWTPFFVVGDQPEPMHEAVTSTLDLVIEDIRRIHEHDHWPARGASCRHSIRRSR